MQAQGFLVLDLSAERLFQRYHPRAPGYLGGRVQRIGLLKPGAAPALAGEPHRIIADIARRDFLAPGFDAVQQLSCGGDGILDQLTNVVGADRRDAMAKGWANARRYFLN